MINYVKDGGRIICVESKKCDRCGKTYLNDFEIQGFHHIDFVAGYSSVFGDGNKIVCDICQHCLKDMINPFYSIES